MLEGSGLAWIDGAVHEIGAGDTLVYLAGGPLHTVDRRRRRAVRARLRREPRAAARAPAARGHGPPRRDAGSRPPTTTRSSARPPPARSSCPSPRRARRAASRWRTSSPRPTRSARSTPAERDVARAAGSVRSGLRHVVVAPGALNCPPHWHAAEHELFVVLDGAGRCELYDNQGALAEEHALRPGHCVSCPAGMRLAHALRAGEQGLTYLAYGTRDTGEIVYYPRSKKAWLGRVLVRARAGRRLLGGRGLSAALLGATAGRRHRQGRRRQVDGRRRARARGRRPRAAHDRRRGRAPRRRLARAGRRGHARGGARARPAPPLDRPRARDGALPRRPAAGGAGRPAGLEPRASATSPPRRRACASC